MLRSLYRLGFDWEALEYFAFVIEAVAGGSGQGCEPADHVRHRRRAGPDRAHPRPPDRATRDSRPVRVGNGAWDQHQNDVWGMLLDAVDTHMRQGAAADRPAGRGRAWPAWSSRPSSTGGDPDQGIWEIRGDPQHFTASKVLCWVAVDRGADLARSAGRRRRGRAWQQAADEMKADILDKGVDERGRFRQHYGNDELDASLLLDPDPGLPPPRRRAGADHRAGDRRRADRGRAGAALQGRTPPTPGSRARRGRSPSAPSGWSPPWP